CEIVLRFGSYSSCSSWCSLLSWQLNAEEQDLAGVEDRRRRRPQNLSIRMISAESGGALAEPASSIRKKVASRSLHQRGKSDSTRISLVTDPERFHQPLETIRLETVI